MLLRTGLAVCAAFVCPACTIEDSGRSQQELRMLPAAEEGEVCRQLNRKAAVRPTAVVRCIVVATAVEFMQPHGCGAPWGVLIALCSQTKWHGLASC